MAKYHMNKKEKEITDQNEILRLLNGGKYAVIAMCSENEPYIVTLSYGYSEKDNCLYFHSALKGLKIDFINNNENVCATIIEDKGYQKDNCEHHYSSVVMWGKMSVISDLDEKKHAMEVLLNHLEENPAPIKERNFKNDEMYSKFALLKLNITEISGKSGN
jgi:uncharacterized protein